MSPREPTFQEVLLVLRAQNGDREALDQVLRAHQASLYRYVRSMVLDAALAQDVLQEVFMIICRGIASLREPRFFRAWAYRIASRRSMRAVRRERKRRDLSIEDLEGHRRLLAAPEAPEPPYDEDLIAHLPSLLAEISPASRAVLSLHYLDEMSLKETADILEIPVGTAKSRLAYGLASLRRRIDSAASSQTRLEETRNE